VNSLSVTWMSNSCPDRVVDLRLKDYQFTEL